MWDPRGWSWLGDVGRVDEEGYLYLTDRASHMIISGGVNIYPREIEDVLVVHPAVADVGVLGTPDPDMGEQVTAFVQLADGASATEAELIEWCRERLSHFKCPREVRFVDDAPPPPHRQAPQAPARLTTSVTRLRTVCAESPQTWEVPARLAELACGGRLRTRPCRGRRRRP